MPLTPYSETVTCLFDAVLDERLAPRALEAVSNYVGASGAAYLLVNKLTRQGSPQLPAGVALPVARPTT